MQVDNNYHPSFKAVYSTYIADLAMGDRMTPGKAKVLMRRFIQKYENSPFDIELSTTDFESARLRAKISQHGIFAKHLKESIFSCIFRSPEKFIEKIDKTIENEIKPALNIHA